MQVVRSSQYIGNGQVVAKEPKTRSGKRKIVLSDTICKLLKSYRKWQAENIIRLGDQWVDSDRLFTSRYIPTR